MNYNDLKKSWQEQAMPNKNIEVNALKDKSSKLPLDKLRKNVYNDMWLQIVSIVLLLFVPQVLEFDASGTSIYYVIYGLFFFIMGYYILKMYQFYKRSNSYHMNSVDALYETYFEVRLYIQIYESYCYSLMPFMFLVLLSSLGMDVLLNMELQDLLKLLLFGTVMSIGFVILVAKLWIKYFYGKYLTKIKAALEAFKEKETLV